MKIRRRYDLRRHRWILRLRALYAHAGSTRRQPKNRITFACAYARRANDDLGRL